MLSILTSLFIFLLTIMLIIMIHEGGHYGVARYFGIKISRVSIGFGKALWRRQAKNGTEYVIAAIPLGGYVRLLDESFNQQTMLKRAAVTLAGPLANFLLAALLYGLVLGLGITHVRPLVGYVKLDSVAARAGLPAQTELISIDGEPATSWVAVSMALIMHLGEKTPVLVQATKDNQPQDYYFDLSHRKSDPLGADWLSNLGMEPAVPPEKLVVAHVNPYKSAAGAGIRVGDKLVAIHNQPITDRMMFLRALKPYAGQAVRLTLERDGRRLYAMTRVGQCGSWRGLFDGYLGLEFAPIRWPQAMLSQERESWLKAGYKGFDKMREVAVFNIRLITKLVSGELSFKALSGPLGILAGAFITMKEGLVYYLNFVAFLSVGLGVINLLPIPGLDGSRLLYLMIEKGRGRPLTPAMETLIFRLGLIILVLLLIQISINDVLRFFQIGGC